MKSICGSAHTGQGVRLHCRWQATRIIMITLRKFGERQALTRARVVAGDIERLGNRFLEIAHVFCYGDALTSEEIAEIVHTRQRKEAQATEGPPLGGEGAARHKHLQLTSSQDTGDL